MSVQCVKEMKTCMDMLGLSPKARTKLKIEEAEVASKWDVFDEDGA